MTHSSSSNSQPPNNDKHMQDGNHPADTDAQSQPEPSEVATKIAKIPRVNSKKVTDDASLDKQASANKPHTDSSDDSASNANAATKASQPKPPKGKAKFTVFKAKKSPSFATTEDSNQPTSQPEVATHKPNNNQTKKNDSINHKDNNKHSNDKTTKDKTPLLKRVYQIFIIMLIVLLIFLVIMFQTLFGKLPQKARFVDIKDGQTYYGFIDEWKSQIPLFSSNIAKLYIKFQVDAPLHAGTYRLPDNPTMPQILSILQQGSKAALVKVQIIEGKTAKDLYKTLQQTSGIELELLKTDKIIKDKGLKKALAIDAKTPSGKYSDNLEGWFAPDTYFFAEQTTDKAVLNKLYQRQKDLLQKAWANRDDNLPYLTAYDALIMASIIEKETGLAKERDKVASVFVNRLRQGMKLQTDPTIIYGMGERYDGNIRKKDIKEKTDYNTYHINGLPPTPIALPSAASIEAALHPADTEYLYFVATGHGGHTFSKTLKEHNKAVKEYLKVTRSK